MSKLNNLLIIFLLTALISASSVLSFRDESNSIVGIQQSNISSEISDESILISDNAAELVSTTPTPKLNQYVITYLDQPTENTTAETSDLTLEPLEFGSNYMGGTFDATKNFPIVETDKEFNSGSNFDVTTQSGRFAEGLDVSQWQGDIDWEEVYAANYKFAFAKSTEGNCYVDPQYENNMINGDNAGVYMGAYHFARPDLLGGNSQLQDARNEASCFARWVVPYLEYTSLVPVLDLEISTGYTWSELSAWTKEFMDTFEEQTGITPIIYINSSYANHLESYLNVYGLWIANWTFTVDAFPDTGAWNSWLVWQYSNGYTCRDCTEYVHVPGVPGRVDLNIYNGDLNLLEQQILINPSEDFFSTQPIVDNSPKYYIQPILPVVSE